MKWLGWVTTWAMLVGQMTVRAQERSYYINDDGLAFMDLTNGGRVIRPEKIAEAKVDKECRPAIEDPEGNWGTVNNGLQASIRGIASEQGADHSAKIRVIVRNVGNEWRGFVMPLGLENQITVVDPNGKQLERKDLADPQSLLGISQRMIRHPHPEGLEGGMQRKFDLDLSKYFDLSAPGKYVVYARISAYRNDSQGSEDVQSGNAIIQIAASPPREEDKSKEWGPVSCGGQLSLRLDVDTKQAGSNRPVFVQVELRNLSDKEISTLETEPILDVTFTAKSPSGKELKSKAQKREDAELLLASRRKLKPHESFTVKINLREAFDLAEPGTYTVTAKRKISIPTGADTWSGCDVVSNELKVNVAAKK